MQTVIKGNKCLLGPSILLYCMCLALCTRANAGDALAKYNVVWDSPSNAPSGSMPIGNGDIGLNVWVEENGDLLSYIGKTDAWSENARLLKLSLVRVKFSPNPFAKGLPFEQILKLREGEIVIRAGREDSKVRLKVWVDANHPAVRRPKAKRNLTFA